ncbi:cathepsin L2 [Aphelenchoides avenae]|nr:cathepsin L2 [Aphelenchus avenae]
MALHSGHNASIVHEEPAVVRAKRQIPITTSLDYRTKGWVTPVRNQAQCGSCWAFAATAGYESVLARYWGDKNDLSEQYVVDCASPPNYGCNGGWVDKALDYLKSAGHTLESYYPYTATEQACKNWVFRPYVNSVTYFYSAAEANVDYHVYHFGPPNVNLLLRFRVPADFQYYSGGVYDPPACATTNYSAIGWHGMAIVGYTPDYWIAKNSWGTGFGDQGYVYYKRGKNLCEMSQFTCVTKA